VFYFEPQIYSFTIIRQNAILLLELLENAALMVLKIEANSK